MHRREFLNKSTRLIGLGTVAPAMAAALGSCEEYVLKESPFTGSSITLLIGPGSPLDADTQYYLTIPGVGISRSFGKYNYGIPLIIMRQKEDGSNPADNLNNFVCYSGMCSHDHCIIKELGAELPAGPDQPLIICHCHGSKYDPFDHARVVNGPALQPLKEFAVTYNSESMALTISF